MNRFAIHFLGLGILVYGLPLEQSSIAGRALIALGIALSMFRVRASAKVKTAIKVLVLIFVAIHFFTIIGLVTNEYLREELVYSDLFRQMFVLLFVFSILLQWNNNVDFIRDVKIWALLIVLSHVGVYAAVGLLDQISAFSYDSVSAKNFKNIVREDRNVPFNSLVPATLMCLSILFISIDKPVLRKVAGTALVLAVIALPIFTGVRTTLVCGILSLLMYFLMRSEFVFRPFFRRLVLFVLFPCFGLLYFVFSSNPYNLASPVLAEATTGRSELWFVAMQLHAQNPVFGVGANHSLFDLFSHLELFGSEHIQRFEKVTGGAMHSAWFTILAEKGIVALFAAILAWSLVFRSIFLCGRSLTKQGYNSQNLAFSDFIILAATVFGMFILSFGESFGIFGFANSQVDFLSYLYISMCLAITENVAKAE